MSDITHVNVGYVPVPRPGLQTFFHHLCVGYLKRYPFWRTVKMSWRFRNLSPILSIEPLTEVDIERCEELVAEYGLDGDA